MKRFKRLKKNSPAILFGILGAAAVSAFVGFMISTSGTNVTEEVKNRIKYGENEPENDEPKKKKVKSIASLN